MIVQIDKHRGALRSCHQEVVKFSEHVGANRMHLVIGGEPTVGILSPKNIEVVEPEIGHHFLELPLAVYRANELLRLKVSESLLWRGTQRGKLLHNRQLSLAAALVHC